MRWLSFIICAFVAIILQSAVAVRLEIVGVRPDWLLVVVVFFALHARPIDAVTGAWLIGICADLMTIERVGLMSLSYALAAMLVISARDYLFRYRALTQLVVTLAVCLIVRLGWMVYCLIWYPQGTGWWSALEVVAVSAYTAAFAPVIHKVLLRFSKKFGLPRRRYTHTGPFDIGGTRV